MDDSCEDSFKRLHSHPAGFYILPRDWIPAGWLNSLQGESWLHQDSFDESGDQQNSCEVSRKSLGTSRIAVNSLGRVWRPGEWL